ncbi:MAG: HPP family protein [Gammaproteobacteria bacterium]|nr:HPP family protein [Gammaproteobacteria bacterium]
MSAMKLETLAAFLGIEADTTEHREKLLSGLGGLLGILAVAWICSAVTAGRDLPYLVASMGASAVLLFAAPHGKFSQPWSVFGGHVISALIGVACARWVTYVPMAAALAVGLTIVAMHYLRCIHPPSGGTALVAVFGSAQIHALGYGYAIMPVGLNVLVLLTMAMLLNYPFPWRRYPLHLHRHLRPPTQEAVPETSLSNRDLAYALKHIGSQVDVTAEELELIFRLAEQHAQSDHLPVTSIRLGHYYSNGKYGAEWSVRQVVDQGADHSADGLMIFKGVAGAERRSTGTCTRHDFARWAKYEVYLNENSWQRVNL